MTLRTRLTAAFVLVVLVPLLVVVVVVTVTLPAAVGERQQQGVASASRLAAAVVTAVCDRARAAAEAVARVAAADGGTSAGVQAGLDDLVLRGVADGVRLVSADGRTVGSSGSAPAVPAQDCAAGGVLVEGDTVQLAAVVELAGASTAGTALAVLDAGPQLAQTLQASAGAGEVLLLAGGRVVAGSGAVDEDVVRDAVDAGGAPVQSGGRVAALTPARPGQPLGVVVVQRENDSPGVLALGLGVAAVAVVVACGIAFLLARITTRPLGELGDAAERVAAGDLSTTIDVRSQDEVGRLAGSFNAMTVELRNYVGALQASRDELQVSRDELQAGVARIGDTLSGTHDLDRILTVVLETAQAATRAGAGAVLLLAPDRAELELTVGEGLDGRGAAPACGCRSAAGVAGSVARTGEALRGRIGDVGLVPGDGEPEAEHVLAVPLLSATTVIGVLCLYDRTDGLPFDEGDLATLRTFASQAAVAVDNVLLHEEAQRLSITDGLTGLWNYRYFTMTVGKEIERAARFSRPLALLLLDIDHFKLVNDVYGHQRGDAVLVELAARVRGEVRDVDTVARYGGEEFVVVLPETDEAGAVQAAERIRAAIRGAPFGGTGAETPLDGHGQRRRGRLPVHGTSAAALLRRPTRRCTAPSAPAATPGGWPAVAARRGLTGALGSPHGDTRRATQGRDPGRRPRHPLPAGHQGRRPRRCCRSSTSRPSSTSWRRPSGPASTDVLMVTGRNKKPIERPLRPQRRARAGARGQGRPGAPRAGARAPASWPPSTTSGRATRRASATPCSPPPATSARSRSRCCSATTSSTSATSCSSRWSRCRQREGGSVVALMEVPREAVSLYGCAAVETGHRRRRAHHRPGREAAGRRGAQRPGDHRPLRAVAAASSTSCARPRPAAAARSS